MYRKLEKDDLVKVQAKKSGPESICTCVCKSEKNNPDEEKAETNLAITQVRLDLDING